MFRFYIDIDFIYIFFLKSLDYETIFSKEFDLKSCTSFIYNNNKI